MKTIFTCIALLTISAGTMAQTFPYAVNSFSSPYAEFNDGTHLINEVWDDPEIAFPLGFDMEILGTNVNSLMQTNLGAGFFFMGDGATFNIFEPYPSDLIDAGDLTGSQISTIQYKVEGPAGNRIGKLQYADCAFYDEVSEGTNLQRVNFQIWFYEQNSIIEIHYGPHSITNSSQVHLGNEGPSVIFGKNFSATSIEGAWNIMGDPMNPQIGLLSFENLEEYDGFNMNPVSGTVIRFSPLTVSVDDREISAFNVYPNPVKDELTVVLESVKPSTYNIYNNLGAVVMSGMTGEYANTINVSGLAPGIYVLQINDQQKKIIKQ